MSAKEPWPSLAGASFLRRQDFGCVRIDGGRTGGVDDPTPLSLHVSWPLTFWMSLAHWLIGPISEVCQVPSGFWQNAINVCPCILTSLQLLL